MLLIRQKGENRDGHPRPPPPPLSISFIGFSLVSSQPSSSSMPPLRLQISATGFVLQKSGAFVKRFLQQHRFHQISAELRFVMMPLEIMLEMLFYFVGFVSASSKIGRAFLWPPHASNLAPVFFLV
ncbi:N-terminal nucleophile aminohydrolases (Ntnhydrolases) superfamily protein [Striga asiatica]|uniref:N-terminal nucleophile aminohydrolases (Ntnhydrolases) superfamily protein n=1 Tax=Striga asiatica TaxID=4170 RepID=A0A5A7RJK8_STRAF|nr:N-terminal nucleophile aminohydrolases (Ntnhydrolases) superfamily protein [Striga asiatica]